MEKPDHNAVYWRTGGSTEVAHSASPHYYYYNYFSLWCL